MISRTKYRIDGAALEKLFRSAGIDGAANIAPLGAGEYNAVFSAKAGGREYAVKIAPTDGTPILTYERDMLASEVYWYGLMRERTSIPVPEIHHADFSRKLIPAGFFIMEKLQGRQMDQMDFTRAEKADCTAQLAKMAAQIHRIKNDRFGYIQNGLYEDWHRAIRAMAQSLMEDAAARGVTPRRGKKLLSLIDKHRETLAKAECSMVNFDIWPPNIICRREEGAMIYAWIDPERSFWGDRIVDFVCLEMMTPLAGKKASLDAYNSVADSPVLATGEERIRYAVAQGYLALIMEVEKLYRYTPFHYGWWRNVAAAAMLYRSAFEALE
ncbi:MAG TPA: aminoglycoside phosphotransferase family protein [Clostridia bacterium]|nr:aminoglycoside phosphotransferase family protein [Clostridia bacterium]